MIISVFDRVENIVRKGENAVYQHFLLLPQCFKKGFFPRHVEGCHCLRIGKVTSISILSFTICDTEGILGLADSMMVDCIITVLAVQQDI